MEIAVIKDRNIRTETDVVLAALDKPLASLRSLVKRDLYKFIKYFWAEYSEEPFQPNWHIEYICKELEKVAYKVANKEPKESDLIINVPPGSTKTATVSIMFPLWCWTNWHWMRFITVSYSAQLALESAEFSRDIMRSNRFKTLFPELDIKQDKDTKSNFRVIKYEHASPGRAPRIIRGGNRFSTSVGGTLTGFHGHIIIWDDPIDPNGAVSEVKVKAANHWMDNVLPFRKVDKKVTTTIGIMQRLHQSDPTGHILKRNQKTPEKIHHICIPGEIKNYKHKVKPVELIDNYKDDLMDPNRLGPGPLSDLLALGQYTYGGQVGQDPIPLGGGMFKVKNFITIDSMPSMEHHVERIVRYWDKSDNSGDGAYTVGVKMAKLDTGKYVVMDVKRGQWSSEERERIIRATAEADGTRVKVYVEQEPGSGGKESATNTIKNLAGFAVERDRPTGDKIFRADPYSVQVNESNVMLLNGMWNKDYVDELEFFPNSTYKDQVDASSGAFAQLAGKRTIKMLRR